MQNYQVVGAVAIFTVASATGPSRQYVYKGGWVPGDVPREEIDHNLSVGLIAPVDDRFNTPVDGNGVETPRETDEIGRPTSNEPEPTGNDEQAKTDEVEAKREAARAKLPTDGSAPTLRHGEDVWVEYAVNQGYDRDAAEKAGKDELAKLFGKK